MEYSRHRQSIWLPAHSSVLKDVSCQRDLLASSWYVEAFGQMEGGAHSKERISYN